MPPCHIVSERKTIYLQLLHWNLIRVFSTDTSHRFVSPRPANCKQRTRVEARYGCYASHQTLDISSYLKTMHRFSSIRHLPLAVQLYIYCHYCKSNCSRQRQLFNSPAPLRTMKVIKFSRMLQCPTKRTGHHHGL